MSGANVQAGLLLVVAAVVLWLLLSHGYLSTWLSTAAAALQSAPAKSPIPFPGAISTPQTAFGVNPGGLQHAQ
jgi:hypothetical protein